MAYKAVIFDLDGTLLDTLDDLADAMNAALGCFGFPVHPVEPYRFFVGNGMLNLARQAAPEGTADDVLERLVGRMGEIYAGSWAAKTRPYPGIPELLAGLRGRGMLLGVLSNKPDVFTQAMVAHFFPSGQFDAVAGAKASVPRKPDPTAALAMARDLGVAPDDIVYVGDTNTDMRTGLGAGMFTVGVSWGFRPVEELRESGAEAVVDSPAGILDLI